MSLASTRTDALLQARGIVFSHPAAADERGFELRVDNLAVRAGEVLALCGPSGSGKSTLVTILAGLLRPQSGQVLLNSDAGPIELYGCSPGEWRSQRRHFGFVYQDPREYLNDRRTVVDIVTDPLHIHKLPGVPVKARALQARLPFLRGLGSRRERRARALLALQKVGITQTQAERKPSSLSGGQRQRVAIARALVADPRVVILDEPTSALDVSVKASIVDLLRKLRQDDVQAAFVLVTHDLPLARQLADRVAILDQGRIVELGDVDQVFQQPASPITRDLIGIARAEQAGLGG
jgi:peptide/nickel transport system ATP-binding protein